MSSDGLEDVASAHDLSDLENGDLQDEVDDLFGDGEDGEASSKPRQLDDEDLDSGDDEGRTDRREPGDEEDEDDVPADKDMIVQPLQLPRHVIPDSSDKEMYLTKIPPFLAVQPSAYQPQTFQPPTTEHHSKVPATAGFDAYQTAITTVRWRHSPADSSELQSNARILRWSDGSLTMQLATDATQQYEIMAAPQSAPQKNPSKPTPTSNLARRKEAPKDSFQYLASGSTTSYGVRVTNHITTSLSIVPSSRKDDNGLVESSLAAIQAKYKAEQDRAGVEITSEHMNIDKFVAEAKKMDREEQRKIRKAERDKEKQVRIGRPQRGGGLTLDALEDSGDRPRHNRPKQRRSQRDELSDEEEEMYGRRGGPQDTYDLEDDFLVGSEEDLEGSDLDAEGEEDIDDVIERQQKTTDRPSPKRARQEDEEEASGNPASPVSRHKRRRVVSDDEDE
ncbi:hypothetical protein BT63DRAFT_480459 [Microthyrium microscopicum]|uniref:Leo1-domain-containing protein n=1 Tax=Microthyrium microscopicum TaxID=703497 RepID=A0A6A6U7E6_9PEZI|nr:hypothetical protein BT63DRAFT_480459 [Microthyrium microscopicum]